MFSAQLPGRALIVSGSQLCMVRVTGKGGGVAPEPQMASHKKEKRPPPLVKKINFNNVQVLEKYRRRVVHVVAHFKHFLFRPSLKKLNRIYPAFLVMQV